jgi:hypothetical protein
MIPAQSRPAAPRFRRGRAFFFAVAAFVAAASCSSDPPNPLGSEDELLGSSPGDVFEDTIAVFGDTVLAYATPIAGDSSMEFGLASGYQRTMVLQISFAAADADTNRVVQRAFLRLFSDEISGTVPARFYRLAQPYAEGDSIPSLDTLAVIPDSTGSADRTLQEFPRSYWIPPALVQDWIRGDEERTAIAVVYTDVSDRIATFFSKNATHDRPTLQITFVGGIQKSYPVSGDATFIRPTAATSNLVVSDGFLRRTYFRIRLDELADDAAVHRARVLFHVVPGSVLGDDAAVALYIPDTDDVTSAAFRSGQAVTPLEIEPTDAQASFPVTNAVFLVLEGTLEDNGFVIRYETENALLRQVELYGSNAPDSLKPRVFITTSTPADFDRGGPN